ncbi:uncharacterized protein [Spinacia oleracea]|uniref:DUF8039 domain-containing protein n=1 Tax=Spinacia oleracea TaxID=3562 RepID=A0ABM3RJ01_SPIOL|nr:uncharacterized protein LOC110796509 [Spinacia oleracea]
MVAGGDGGCRVVVSGGDGSDRRLRWLPAMMSLRIISRVAGGGMVVDVGRKKDEFLRHPADSPQWRTIDKKYLEFGKEVRNLRLSLCTDGMNPYGSLSSQHSTWPVLLAIYNLPPWLCMKRKYIMLSLLISGPKQPGHDIDVYLAPLIDDLKLLWNEGVPIRQDEKSVVQNSGVKVVASSRVYASAKDKRPFDSTQSYYGVIEEIWELDYTYFVIPIFRCQWANNHNASLAKQVFYVVDNIDPRWRVVAQGKRHILGIDDVVDEDEYDECKLGECRILLCEPGSKHRLQKLQLNFPRTVATMDDHRDNEIQGIDGATHPTGESQDTNTSKKTKFRGPSKGVQAKKPMYLQYNQYGIPDGEWSREYGKQVGSCAARININVKEYSTLDEHTKKGFWEETKLMFHIIDDPAKRREKYFHMCVAKRFGAFKSRLTRRWITKKEKMPKHQTDDMPWDIYNQITEDDWKTFVMERNKPEMLVRREKASKSALQTKHPHRTGQKGYVRKRPEWINDGRLPPEAALTLSSGSSSVTSSLTTASDRFKKFRSVEWILAHQVKNKEGKWEVDPNDKEAVNIAKMVLEYIEEEGKGNISFTQGEDALTKAMGKKDHRGRVKATGGVNVGYKVAFGPIDRSSRCGHSEPSPEAVESIRASVRREFEDQLERKVAEALQKQLATLKATGQLNTLSTPALDSALVSDEFDVNRALETARPNSSQQPRELKAITPCRLALEDKVLGNKVIVADGMAYPLDGSLHQHFRSMKPSHYKVQVDCIYDGHDDDTLPVPTGDGLNNLGRALASFVQWPIHLVIFEEDEV